MTQHILFDLDNTVWDFDSNSHLAKVDMFHHFNLDTIFSSFDEFLSIYNTHNTHLWKEYAAGSGISRSEQELMQNAFRY